MILRSYIAWFVSGTVTLLGVALSAAKATAQTTYHFSYCVNAVFVLLGKLLGG